LFCVSELLDHLWEQKLLSEVPLDDGYVEIAGFRERRSAMPSFHKSKRDRDWRVR
jgi:hypothetical protein